MNYFRSHLAAKLLLTYFLVILIGITVIWVTTLFTTPAAYARHLQYMEAQMTGAGMMGQGQGLGQGRGQGGMMLGFYEDFRATFNESLIIAFVVASAVGLAASYALSRGIIAPVQDMTLASQRIAEGRYEERVQSEGTDELSQLAASFNQMASQLEQVEAMRRRLIGDVAHELRTPLTAIKGSAEGLMDGVLPANAETYQQIHNEAERLNKLVNDLQELSRVEAKAINLNSQPVDVARLIETVTKRMQFQFDDKRVTLRRELPQEPLQVLADEDRALQVLTNLLGNALQYTPENGTVTVTIEREQSMAKFSVHDSGIGIPAEHLAHIFDRFYRVDKSRSRAHGGSGIGLTISKHLIEAQGGKIRAESAGPDQGSVFTFTLPLA
ncbi:MAG TPA: ATP-binding protein [Anaerolineales bacterium]|nr:ATP-binding protein [Anaerolineales bacterium]HNN14373.1 ATP-binding protein [Anaerolineales bacterium]HNO31644.1 ATP-binding protein [Anaerolineales bacterium]